MTRRIIMALLGLMTLGAPYTALAADTTYAWFAEAEARIPGQGLQLVAACGTLTTSDNPGLARQSAETAALTQLIERYGSVEQRPRVRMVPPLQIPGLREYIQRDYPRPVNSNGR